MPRFAREINDNKLGTIALTIEKDDILAVYSLPPEFPFEHTLNPHRKSSNAGSVLFSMFL